MEGSIRELETKMVYFDEPRINDSAFMIRFMIMMFIKTRVPFGQLV